SANKIGNVTYLVLDNVVDWVGPLSGEARETLWITVKPTGDSAFHGVDIFPNMTLRFAGVDSGGAFQGRWTAVGANGFGGHGFFSGFDDCGGGLPCGTYTGGFLG